MSFQCTESAPRTFQYTQKQKCQHIKANMTTIQPQGTRGRFSTTNIGRRREKVRFDGGLFFSGITKGAADPLQVVVKCFHHQMNTQIGAIEGSPLPLQLNNFGVGQVRPHRPRATSRGPGTISRAQNRIEHRGPTSAVVYLHQNGAPRVKPAVGHFHGGPSSGKQAGARDSRESGRGSGPVAVLLFAHLEVPSRHIWGSEG